MYWNPDPIAFTIPFIHLPIYIYGICFLIGFSCGYLVLRTLMQKQYPLLERSVIQGLLDQMTWFIVGGTIIGARLGHVIFYDWEHYRQSPWLILNTREGGLASHGGAIGVLLALSIFYFLYFRKIVQKSFLELLDLVVVPTALVAFFIRLGNFFNQEIVGTPSDLPWAVVFGAPAESPLIVSRHPAQLYEGGAYLLTFGLLYFLWRQKSYLTHLTPTRVDEPMRDFETPLVSYSCVRKVSYLRPGIQSGLFFICIFGSRFFIEFVKASQTSILNQTYLQAGQWLSIPFILGGFLIILYGIRYDNRQVNPHLLLHHSPPHTKQK